MLRYVAVLSVLLFGFNVLLMAQSTTYFGSDGDQNTKAYGSIDSQGFDSVDLSNGHLNLKIPIMTYPQRGDLTLGFYISYQGMNSYQGRAQCQDPCYDPPPSYNFSTGGMTFQTTYDNFQALNAYTIASKSGPHYFNFTLSDGSKIAPDGSGVRYVTGIDPTCNAGHGNWGYPFTIVDGSGISYVQTCGVNTGYPTSITDRNGNQISFNNNWTDTLGRSIPGAGSWQYQNNTEASGAFSWTLPGLYGTSATYSFSYENAILDQTCTTNAFCSAGNWSWGFGAGAIGGAGDTDPLPLTKLQYPDGSQWVFTYDTVAGNPSASSHQGDLIQVTTPNGATVQYQWGVSPLFTMPLSNPNANGTCFEYSSGIRVVKTRTVSYGTTNPQTWTYSLTEINTPGNPSTSGSVPATDWSVLGTPYGMLVTAPDGSRTLHVFQGLDNTCTYEEVETDVGSLSTTSTTYAHTAETVGGITDGTIRWAAAWPTDVRKDTSSVHYDYAFATAINGNGQTANLFLNLPSGITVTDGITRKIIKTATSYYWQSNPTYLTAGLFRLPSSVSTYLESTLQAQTNYTYDESSGLVSSNITTGHVRPLYGLRGNISSTSKWLNTTNSFVPIAHFQYYDTGKLHATIDPLNLTTSQILYDTSYFGAYPTSVSDVFGHTSQSIYDLTTGLLTSSADPNMSAASKNISYVYYPSGTYSAGHLESVTNPDGGGKTYSYSDVNTTLMQVAVDSGVIRSTNVILDGLGRKQSTQILNMPASPVCPGTTIYEDIYYDFASHVNLHNKPYCDDRSDQTFDYFSSSYDALGRETSWGWNVDRNSDFGSSQYLNTSVELDQNSAGNLWSRTYDAQGNIVQVLEPSDQNNDGDGSLPTVPTNYGYDALGNLLSVTQSGDPNHAPADVPRSRNFIYNSLSELTHSANPETGSRDYSYDSRGNVQTVTDARGVTKLYCYDHANRELSESFTDTTCPDNSPSTNPSVVFQYDSPVGTYGQSNLLGRLSAVRSYSNGTETSLKAYSYDLMGRVTTIYEKLPSDEVSGSSHSLGLTYNFEGALKQITYPSGRIIQYSRDSLGRMSSIQDVTPGVAAVPYLSGMVRFADDSDYQYSLGNGVTVTTQRDSRSHPSEWVVSNAFGAHLLDWSYYYGDRSHPGLLEATIDNQQTNTITVYSYDILERLSGFANYTYSNNYTINTNVGQSYLYDPFGNLTQTNGVNMLNPPGTYGPSNKLTPSATGCGPSGSSIAIDPSNPTYDLAGNVLCDGISPYTDQQYIYEKNGRLAQVAHHQTPYATYTYSGDGNRIRKDLSSGVFTEYLWSDLGVLSERSSDGTWTDYVPNEKGQKIARVSGGNVNYYLTDLLGTTQMEMDAYGNPAWQGTFSPFGQELDTQTSVTKYKFTGKERDSESGLDDFDFRSYASTMGRWMSPDPSGLQYADFTNPQSLNLYSYVLNNPLTFTDPSGLYCYWDDGSSDDDPKDGGASKGDCGKQGGTWTDQLNPCKGADGCTTTTNNNPAPIGWSDTLNYMDQWKAGTLSQNIMYLQNSGWVATLRQAPGVNAGYNKYVSGGCKDSSQPFSPGHGAGATTNAVQAETGDFDMSSATSGNTVTFTVTNTSGQASWSGANSTGGKGLPFMRSGGTKDNPNGANGPRHNVNQTFVWSEPVPCQGGNTQ